LKRRNARTLEFASVNSAHADRTLAVADIDWIARIVWVRQ
jgi:phage repressor protein C with HTH and peptisase S24 domain